MRRWLTDNLATLVDVVENLLLIIIVWAFTSAGEFTAAAISIATIVFLPIVRRRPTVNIFFNDDEKKLPT